MLLFRASILFIAMLFGSSIMSQASKAGHSEMQNFTDANGFRQGFWQITGALSVEEGYKKDNVVEEGQYVDNKREGLWKKYFPAGTIRSEITYADNKPYGAYKTFYANGRVEEEGVWKGNKNTGSFKRFYENGNPANTFLFNEKGKRTGLQSYFHENGKLQMTVEIDNGVAHGELKVYAPDGKLIEEKRLTNGEIEQRSVKQYAHTDKPATAVYPELSRAETTPPAMDKPNLGEFKANGKNTLYNRNKQVSQAGEFKEGHLWNGKWFRYDENGIIKQVEIYKEGRFVGYGIIEGTNK